MIQVEDRSPADRAGLRTGDKVEEFEGAPIRRMSDLGDAHGKCKPKQKVTITVRRGTRLLDLGVTLGDE